MSKQIKIKEDDIYIVEYSNATNYAKFKILEVTKTTYHIKNLDADTTFRESIEAFKEAYTVIEVIKDAEKEFKEIIDTLIEELDNDILHCL